MEDYGDCDATELAARVARGEASPLQLVELAITAIERVNPQLNAIVHRMYDDARARAQAPLPEGPFRGVPMLVKDFDGFVRGVPFTASCRLLENYVPDHDSEAIARLRRAGLLFLAKTNCPELALLGTTEPKWRGPTRNPYDLTRSTGGSSGGSAAMVAARAVPVAHGGDGGGSLRIPASHCGLVGLKATRGRVPMGPDYGEGWGGYVQWGVLSRSVRDTAALLDAMAGPMPGDPYAAPPLPGPLSAEVGRDPGALRIGFDEGTLLGREIDPQHAAAVTQVARKLEALGHRVEQAKPAIDREALVRAYLVQIATGTAAEVVEFAHMCGREASAELFEPETWFMNQVGRATSAVDLLEARTAVQLAGRVTAEFHTRYDLFLSASTAYPQIRIGEFALNAAQRLGLATLRKAPIGAVLHKVMHTLAPTFLERTPNTQLFNQTGQPAISLPLAEANDGMPIGVQLAAALGREDLLIRIAAQLEAAHPWHSRRPRVNAMLRP
ncbi:MAG TPA: amidase [Polyangiales bacterium]|nr:amidase [Polyangiales bacterium]